MPDRCDETVPQLAPGPGIFQIVRHGDARLGEQGLIDKDAVGQLVHWHGVALAIPLALFQGDRDDVGNPVGRDVLVQRQQCATLGEFGGAYVDPVHVRTAAAGESGGQFFVILGEREVLERGGDVGVLGLELLEDLVHGRIQFRSARDPDLQLDRRTSVCGRSGR